MKCYPRVGEGEAKDIFERLEAVNLVEILKLGPKEWDSFVRDNRCAICGGHILAQHEENRQYSFYCPEHGPITHMNYVSAGAAEQANQGVLEGKRELRDKPEPRSEDEILKELGF